MYRLSSTDVSQVKASYLEFFDHISVRSGWRKPVFTAEDVTDLFHIAAEVVVSVRLELDAVNNSLPVPERKLVIRQIDGSAQVNMYGMHIYTQS